MTKIRILGLDPSLAATGWAVLEVDCNNCSVTSVLDMGTITSAPSKVKKVRKSSDKLARSRAIAKRLDQVIKEYDIKVATSEIPSGAKSASAAFAFGIVTGLVASLPIPVIEVTPTEVKLAACGNKIADKEDIMRWAITVTEGSPAHSLWKTGNVKNEFEIELGGKYLTKTMEHQADAIAVGKACADSEPFRQMAGVLSSVLG